MNLQGQKVDQGVAERRGRVSEGGHRGSAEGDEYGRSLLWLVSQVHTYAGTYKVYTHCASFIVCLLHLSLF